MEHEHALGSRPYRTTIPAIPVLVEHLPSEVISSTSATLPTPTASPLAIDEPLNSLDSTHDTLSMTESDSGNARTSYQGSMRPASIASHSGEQTVQPSPSPPNGGRQPATTSSNDEQSFLTSSVNGQAPVALEKSLPTLPASSASRDRIHLAASTASYASSAQSSQLRASTATSNSSIPPGPFVSRNTSSAALEDVDHTAALIQRLYDRLDKQGVPGDGWDEGRERSRDGIISVEEAEGANTVKENRRKEKPRGSSRKGESSQLPWKEEHILKRVDRYGFFSSSHPAALASQYNRLSTLSTSAFLALPGAKHRRSKTPNTPSMPSSPKLSRRASSQSLLSSITPHDMAIEAKRIDKWGEMLTVASRDEGGNAIEWTLAKGWWDGRKTGGGKYRKFQRRVFKGVPDRWRRAVWGLEMEKMASEAVGPVRSLDELKREYERFLTTPSNQDVQIDLDVPRTISGHVLFHTRYGHGQRALFHVLHAFGLHCVDIGGYCQGMGPIAATLLCYFEPERTYASLVRLFYEYDLRHIFAPGFPGLLQAFYIQERLVETLMPDVHKAFQTHCISTSAYATKWYITLFANSVPFGTQLRLWDGLLLEGIDFLVVTAVAIIWCFRGDFVDPTATFESILSILSSYFLIESDEALMRWIRKTIRRHDIRNNMKTWRSEWQGFVRDGSADRRVT